VNRSLGVDLGASWLRVCLAESGKELWSVRRPAVDWRLLPRALARMLKRRRLHKVGTLVVGSTRIGSHERRAVLLRALRPLAHRVRILSDHELAHLAAFGHGPGAALLASTGSVAFARGADGRGSRAGGYGPLLGDEGSGFWLGREGAREPRLRLALRLPHPLALAHARDPVRATAALAPRVLAGSPRLRREAAAHLSALAREACRGLPMPHPIPLTLHGSLFRDARLKRAVLRSLGRGWALVEPRVSAERAAAGL
jgi:glucosamine kinase